MKIVDYKIITGDCESDLQESVKVSIKDGWQPFCSILIKDVGDYRWYSQAMVKYEEATISDREVIQNLSETVKCLYLRIEALEKLVVQKEHYYDTDKGADKANYENLSLDVIEALEKVSNKTNNHRTSKGHCQRCDHITTLSITRLPDYIYTSTCLTCSYVVRKWRDATLSDEVIQNLSETVKCLYLRIETLEKLVKSQEKIEEENTICKGCGRSMYVKYMKEIFCSGSIQGLFCTRCVAKIEESYADKANYEHLSPDMIEKAFENWKCRWCGEKGKPSFHTCKDKICQECGNSSNNLYSYDDRILCRVCYINKQDVNPFTLNRDADHE